MAVHVNAHEGLSGSFGLRGLGGAAGTAGKAGKGGVGGDGGKGGTYLETVTGKDGQVTQVTKNFPKGSKGSSGGKGKDGEPAVAGGIGKRGKCGLNGLPGKVLYRVVDNSGKTVAEGPTPYDPAIIYLAISDGMKDNIFEPGEELHISKVEIHNFGSIPLPKGTQLSFPTTETIENLTQPFALPEVPAFKTSTISNTFKVKIPDIPAPTKPGSYSSKAVFRPELALLNRQFEQCTYSIEVDVKYPVKLVNISGSKQMGRGDKGTFRVGVRNISTRTYCEPSDKDTEVFVRFYFTEYLQAVDGKDVPDSKETYFEVKVEKKILSGETVMVEATAKLQQEAPLFHRIPWRAELYLRKKLIEFKNSSTRVAPIYNGLNPPGDVLLFTGPSITRDEYLAWMKMFDVLGLKVDLWDTEHEHGISTNSRTKKPHTAWKGRYTGKMIVFPMGNPLDAALLEGEDALAHFTSVDKVDQLIGEDKAGTRRSILINADSETLAKLSSSAGAGSSPIGAGTGHNFERAHFSKPTWCNHCGNFIWGIGKQGYRCEKCKFCAHDKCYKLITVRCGEAVAAPELKKSTSDGNLKHTTNKKALQEQQRKSEATAFGSSLLVLGADPFALRDRILKVSPILTYSKDEFGSNHLMGSPSQNYAISKAKEIRRKLEKGDPNHYFQQGELKVKLEKQAGNRWFYGDLTIHRCPINTASRLMIRPAVAVAEKLVTDKFNPLTESEKFPITSYFSQVFIALLSGLTLEQRLALLASKKSPALEWKFGYSGGTASLQDMIKLILYQDLKTDVDTQNKLMFNHSSLCDVLQKSEFQTDQIKKLIWYCENRIKSSCFSVNVFGAKHSMGKKVNKEFSAIHKLIGAMDPETKKQCELELKTDRTRHAQFNIWAALGSTVYPLRRQRKKYERARRAGLSGKK